MAEVRPETPGAASPSTAAAKAAARALELSRWRTRLAAHDPVSRSRLNQAQQRLDVALQGAAQAADRAALACLRAALAHDGAAALHEQLAARGIGEVSWHEEQGRRHRAAAEADRQRASVLAQPQSRGPDARSA